MFSALWHHTRSDGIREGSISVTFLNDFYVLLYHMLVETGGKGDEVGILAVCMAQAHPVEVFKVAVYGEHGMSRLPGCGKRVLFL
jgi:hypothetical protein